MTPKKNFGKCNINARIHLTNNTTIYNKRDNITNIN